MPIFDLFNSKKQVSADVKKVRISICERCKMFRPATRQCGICRCFIDLKTKLATEQCPVKKWRQFPPFGIKNPQNVFSDGFLCHSPFLQHESGKIQHDAAKYGTMRPDSWILILPISPYRQIRLKCMDVWRSAYLYFTHEAP